VRRKRPRLRGQIEDEEEDPQKEEGEDADRSEDEEEEKAPCREATVCVLVQKLNIKNSQRARLNSWIDLSGNSLSEDSLNKTK
jgi:hypothetical protein